MMGDVALKSAVNARSITEKEDVKASTEGSSEQEKDKKTPAIKVLLATVDYVQNQHFECNWFMPNFGVRESAHAGKIEALKRPSATRATWRTTAAR